ncbi:MAG: putative O-methyltransferase [Firmicutes bacterium]|nr:putative O-methyltransferase [Bacillota bacterium]
MNDLLKILEDYAAKHQVPIIAKDSAVVLEATVAAKRPAAVLEIGTAIGYSTLLIAASAAFGTKITTIEIDEARAKLARSFFEQAGLAPYIELLVGDAAQILPQLTGNFDLVFIDAAKGQYLDYLSKILGKLSPGAVIIADNVLFRGLVAVDDLPPKRYRTLVKRLRAYLEFVTSDPRFETKIHDIGDGIAVTYYRGENNY